MSVAVILMNLGSPDSVSTKDVRKYLNEFLMDERVIDIPYLKRTLLVKGIITPFRSPRSAKAYKKIWTADGSPLIVLTEELKKELEKLIPQNIHIMMRYGNPSPTQVFDQIHAENPDISDILIVPLYPHYAMSSYETAVVYALDCHKKSGLPSKLHFVAPFYNEKKYIDSLVGSIKEYLENPFDKILFSYHGIPERHIKKSDPNNNYCLVSGDCCQKSSSSHEFCYRHQCFETTRLVVEKLGLKEDQYEISFQSRLGRDPWLLPATADRLEELPKEGVKKLLVVCPSFVSDCLETLEEISIEGKSEFLEHGGEQFDQIPCLNTSASWVECLSSYVEDFSKGNHDMIWSADKVKSL